jgi:hypothetical protein
MTKTHTLTKASRPHVHKGNGLKVCAYAGDGSVLLAFDFSTEQPPADLAGFAVECTPPSGKSYYLQNRLSFDTNYDSSTTAEQREWTSSLEAPFQKFRWIDFPPDLEAGKAKTYKYTITAMLFEGKKLQAGPTTEISIELGAKADDDLEVAFTRGYLSSQAYAAKFKNAPIEPTPKSIDFNTAKYEQQYEWLGYHARELLFDFLDECVNDDEVTVDAFTFDLDEPDVVRKLQEFGSRLRLYQDDSKIHVGPKSMEPRALDLIRKTAGANHVRTGHFKRFSHNKVLIKKRGGVAEKVLAGSANFSVRGLYVQANNVFVFDNSDVAQLYEEAFEQAFTDPHDFTHSSIAEGWHDIHVSGLPKLSFCFSPHTSGDVSLDRVAEAIRNAKSSVLFAIMDLSGGGPVFQEIQDVTKSGRLYYYGVTQSMGKLKLYKPYGEDGIIVPFSFLQKNVPAPFRQEWSGGMGQVIHHKFIVLDFNTPNAVAFAGSSNIAQGGEQSNSDNLVAFYDPHVATAYGVEAVRLVDHYHFRAAMKTATSAEPLRLADASQKWWKPYYDAKNEKFRERRILAP